ncbi:MAG: helix-turn-helix domain-containing protein [Flavobacteriaceae bacterium]|nr:helix-turn-helix domain-containing protein [Flavobacteriaceae bacterium]
MNKNPELELALNFVEKTDRNIFLTGKAGTGKTTFLHKIKTESNKRLVIVAPTGVAAINAKGVTIHSFFQMPFGPIIPGVQAKKSKFRFGKIKIDIIKSLDLLIIDEISMVRADLLDGIDQVLRRYKNRNKVFGGVQVLMIGDLQQLSPVVKPHEWSLLSPHYETPYFFSSLTFKESNAVGIELKHIYRQDNQEFIGILNEIRNDKLSDISANKLNERFQPNFSPKNEEGYITLTTHNNRANAINDLELNKLDASHKIYNAVVKGKFNEYAYPTHEKLKLKVGAQVMFIKNDSDLEKRYYNGKIGVITYLSEDSVGVKCIEDDAVIDAAPEIWENVSYAIHQETKEIKEEIAGSFAQIPLRLAWAITIHKSQGLTFEKAIIDAEASFAHGQTYVALSRCKSLEGIVLKTKISSQAIINDARVTSFTNKVEENLPNQADLDNSQKIYQLNLMEDLFSYQPFLYPTQRLIKIYYENKTSFRGNIIEPLNKIKDNGIVKLMKVATSFKIQLHDLSVEVANPEEDKKVQERIHKGIHYFIEHTLEYIKKPFDDITFSTENKAVKKDFNKQLDNLEDLLTIKLTCLWGLTKGFSTEKYLELRAKAVLEKSDITKPTPKKKGKVRAEIVDTEHPILFEQLRALRKELSEKDDCPPFQIFTQISLFEMCAYFPKTPKELKSINGMGKIRVEKYGDKILEIITNYISENETTPKEVIYVDKSISKDTKPKNVTTKQHSLNLFKSGKTIEEIAEERELTKGTIEGHLTYFISTGEIKTTDIMPAKKYEELKKIMQKTKFDSFSELKNKIDDKFTYAELRLVAADLELNKK